MEETELIINKAREPPIDPKAANRPEGRSIRPEGRTSRSEDRYVRSEDLQSAFLSS